MTRYRLPDALGGGEIEAEEQWTGCAGADIHYHVAGSKVVVSVPSQSPLAEVPPPTPAEPPPGAYLIGDRLAVRVPNFDNWICAVPDFEGGNPFWDWEPLWRHIGGPDVAITPLVPRDLPEVELPWEGGPPAFYGSPLRVDRAEAGTVRVGVGICSVVIEPGDARGFAAAVLLSAAGPDTEREA